MNYDRIKTDLVVQYLKQYDLPLFGDLEERAKRLANYFATAHGKTTIAQCSNCNGLSDANLDECPFCGDNEPISNGGEAHEIEPVAEPEVLPAIEPQVTSSSELTSADLDNAVQTIRGCVQQAIHNVHIIGRVLKRVRVLELWTLRTNARGEPIYSSFWEFCSSEVGVKPARARKLMAIGENFTRDQVEAFGLTRLSVSLSLPEGRRGEFLDKASVLPANDRDLRQLARGMKGMDELEVAESTTVSTTERAMVQSAGGVTQDVTQDASNDPPDDSPPMEPTEASEQPDAPAPPKQPHFEHTMTADVPLGLHVLDMWRRPNRPGRVGATTLRARHIADLPWAKLQLADDLMLHIRLIADPVGDIRAAVEFRRGKDHTDAAG